MTKLNWKEWLLVLVVFSTLLIGGYYQDRDKLAEVKRHCEDHPKDNVCSILKEK